MQILLTGGNGYIGSHIIVELLSNTNHDIIVVDNLSHSDVTVPHKIYKLTKKYVTFYNIDLRDEKLKTVFEKHNITHVIHLAGLKSVGESNTNPLSYYDHNVAGTINLLKIMKEYKVNTIIFSSSATVYQNATHLLHEQSILAPSNPYGHTKLVVELLLSDLCKDPEFNCVILRYFNPIGNHPSGSLMELKGDNIIPKLSDSLINNTTFKIYGQYDTPDTSAIRDYIHVVDLARGHIAVLEQKGYHVYNLGSGKGTSVLQLLNTMEKISGHKINYEYGERRLGDLGSVVCDPSKIKKELGWETIYDLQTMCQDILTGLKVNQLL